MATLSELRESYIYYTPVNSRGSRVSIAVNRTWEMAEATTPDVDNGEGKMWAERNNPSSWELSATIQQTKIYTSKRLTRSLGP